MSIVKFFVFLSCPLMRTCTHTVTHTHTQTHTHTSTQSLPFSNSDTQQTHTHTKSHTNHTLTLIIATERSILFITQLSKSSETDAWADFSPPKIAAPSVIPHHAGWQKAIKVQSRQRPKLIYYLQSDAAVTVGSENTACLCTTSVCCWSSRWAAAVCGSGWPGTPPSTDPARGGLKQNISC